MRAAAVLGVGNRMRGDDAIGPRAIDALQGQTRALLIDCGTAPENFIGPLVAAQPARVLFIDACALPGGGRPGEFRLFSRQQVDELAAGLVSTHTLPLGLTVALLGQQVSAEIALLGVQPAQIEFGQDLSPELSAALPGIVRFVRDWLARP